MKEGLVVSGGVSVGQKTKIRVYISIRGCIFLTKRLFQKRTQGCIFYKNFGDNEDDLTRRV